MADLFGMTRGATFSPCETYRYRLWRTWSDAPPLNFLMLNPSTADEEANDPTVERCQRRAAAMGFGGLIVTNLFAMRSTDPRALYGHPDPIGPQNDHHIIEAARAGSLVICGWGAHADKVVPGRAVGVLNALRFAGAVPHALALNADGSPGHPLYVGYAVAPMEMPG